MTATKELATAVLFECLYQTWASENFSRPLRTRREFAFHMGWYEVAQQYRAEG